MPHDAAGPVQPVIPVLPGHSVPQNGGDGDVQVLQQSRLPSGCEQTKDCATVQLLIVPLVMLVKAVVLSTQLAGVALDVTLKALRAQLR